MGSEPQEPIPPTGDAMRDLRPETPSKRVSLLARMASHIRDGFEEARTQGDIANHQLAAEDLLREYHALPTADKQAPAPDPDFETPLGPDEYWAVDFEGGEGEVITHNEAWVRVIADRTGSVRRVRVVPASGPEEREGPDAIARHALMSTELANLIAIAHSAKGVGDGRDWKRVESRVQEVIDALFTEQAMHRAWRKRAEEAEAASRPAVPASGERERLAVTSQESRTHDLKVWPAFFEALNDGRKTFEWRKNDRDFRTGDTLRLREWDPNTEAYTGRDLIRTVSYMQTDFVGSDFGFPAGYAVLALASPAAAPRNETADSFVDRQGGQFTDAEIIERLREER